VRAGHPSLGLPGGGRRRFGQPLGLYEFLQVKNIRIAIP